MLPQPADQLATFSTAESRPDLAGVVQFAVIEIPDQT
jgi:hypothetical protein